jgi:uncharacterized coiled-coil protein SlyX
VLSGGCARTGLPKARARRPRAHHIDTTGIGADQEIVSRLEQTESGYTPVNQAHDHADRLDAIEIKLSHLEVSVQELDQALARQQREIALLEARNRALEQQMAELAIGGAQAGTGFEKPPHY